jgi:rhamnulokinase
MSCWISRVSASAAGLLSRRSHPGPDGHAEEQLGRAEIYRRSGIQFLPFNTLYQLRALVEQQPELVSSRHALLIPDYFSFRLTGNLNWEYTNATTTQLVNINSDNWDETLLNWTGAPRAGSVRRPIPAM